jgi:hypothetical protein
MLTCGPLFRSGCGEVLLGTDFLGLGAVFLGLGAVFHNGIVAGVIRRGSQSALLYIVPGWPISTSNQATSFLSAMSISADLVRQRLVRRHGTRH